MAKKRNKPHDPAAAARHRAEREAEREMVEFIAAQPSTAVNRDPRTGRLVGAWRLNCFNTLLQPGGAERAAVDWLDELVRAADGENAPERRPDYIPTSAEGAPGQNVTQAMIRAGFTLSVTLHHMPAAHARLLMGLLKPDADLITRWRAVVERHTGETNPQAQGAIVRAVCSHLAWIKDHIGALEKNWREARKAA